MSHERGTIVGHESVVRHWNSNVRNEYKSKGVASAVHDEMHPALLHEQQIINNIRTIGIAYDLENSRRLLFAIVQYDTTQEGEEYVVLYVLYLTHQNTVSPSTSYFVIIHVLSHMHTSSSKFNFF